VPNREKMITRLLPNDPKIIIRKNISKRNLNKKKIKFILDESFQTSKKNLNLRVLTEKIMYFEI
jgi:hypothetical protein